MNEKILEKGFQLTVQGKLAARTQSIVETDFRYEKNEINGGRVSRFRAVGRSEI